MTGTFDDWSKSVQLDHDGTIFQKTVSLPSSTDKIYYKVSQAAGAPACHTRLLTRRQFVVDGEWTTSDHSDAKSETDPSGNVNNYLDADDIKPPTNPIISSVAPGAS